MATRIQVRRDTATNWTSANPTLASGELGLVTDSGKVVACKVGDGSAAWTALEYAMPMMQGVPNVNRTGDTSDTTFLLKGLGSQASVFAIEEASGTDKILNISDVGLITLTDGAGNTKVLVTSASGDIAVNTDKLTVAGATGNTTIAGTLDVAGETTTVNNSIVKGSTKFLKVQNAGGADKFTVATDNGNITLASGATVTGDITGVDATTLYAPADVAKASGGGSVVQVQYTQIEEPHTDTLVGRTPLTLGWFYVTITPKSANSVIKIDMSWSGQTMAYAYTHGFNISRAISGGDTTILAPSGGGDVGSRYPFIKSVGVGLHLNLTTVPDTCDLMWYDTPNTTAAVTYSAVINNLLNTASGTFCSGRTTADSDGVGVPRMACIISATELAAKA